MRALVLESLGKVTLREVPVPKPKAGEVLLKIKSAPVHPSDLVFIQGQYGIKRDLPTIPGFEGAGEVVEAGEGVSLPKRVSCYISNSNGTWAQYAVAKATECVPLPDQIPFDLGSCFYINPYTAEMFMELVRQGNHKAIIQNAAASSLGRMMVKYCKHEGIKCLSIVRRKDRVTQLEEVGAEHILNSRDEDFNEKLQEKCNELGITAAFDPVGGEMAGTLLNSMKYGAELYLYGQLSGKPLANLDIAGMLFQRKKVQGLWMPEWLGDKSQEYQEAFRERVFELLPSVLKTEILKGFDLEEYSQAMRFYKLNMSKGKIVFKPNESSN